MINFDYRLPSGEWHNITVDNWFQFVGFVGDEITIRNIKRMEDIQVWR
jgi:hypothetical protein